MFDVRVYAIDFLRLSKMRRPDENTQHLQDKLGKIIHDEDAKTRDNVTQDNARPIIEQINEI